MIKIGIDGRSLESNPAGIGRYVLELCKAMDKLMPDAQFYLYTKGPLNIQPISPRWHLRCEQVSIFRKIKSIAWLRWFVGRYCAMDDIDIFWGGATFLPAHLRSKVKTISTVHDINHILVPETMPIATLIAYKLFFSRDIQKADAVISNSYGTKARLKKHCDLEVDYVVTPGVSNYFTCKSTEEVNRIRLKYKIGDEPYILALSTLEPRKNLVNLVQAFLNQKNLGNLTTYKLVLVGGNGWKNSVLEGLLAKAPREILRCGYVDEEDLPAIYTGAAFFAFPSIYEGFGIPALEAVACGTAVLATDIPEIIEAAQGNGIFTKTDVTTLGKSLAQAAIDFKSYNYKNSKLTNIDWDEKAQVYVKVIKELMVESEQK